MLSNEILFFSIFSLFVVVVMLIDLGVFSKQKSHIVSFQEAGIWSAIWVALSVAFYFFLKQYGYLVHDVSDMAHLQDIVNQYAKHLKLVPDDFQASLQIFQNNMALEYITGYLVEYSLSADNIFVFILIFKSFGVHERFYKKILIWGISGAVILRFIFIFVGAALLQQFSWIIYIFGAFLVYTGVKILVQKEEEEQINPNDHFAVKFASRYFNVYNRNVVDRFIIYHKRYQKRYITPIFVVVIVIAFTDLIFAVDSIPAIFSITKDPYIVFFSNVFAIMGLRSMFFFLASIMDKFHYLKPGLGILLSFIGLKMLGHHYLELWGFKTIYSLYIIIAILAVSIIASLLFPKKEESQA
ncbi:MAG: TerC/Alx family metal homeostasis membrane protein [Spirosomataceae bacterium]